MFGNNRVHWKKRKETMRPNSTRFSEIFDGHRQTTCKDFLPFLALWCAVVVSLFVMIVSRNHNTINNNSDVVDVSLPYRNIQVCYWSKYFQIECIECMVDFTQNTTNDQIYKCFVYSDLYPRNESTIQFRNQSVEVSFSGTPDHPMIYNMHVDSVDSDGSVTDTVIGTTNFVRILYTNISKISFINKMCQNITKSVFLMDSIQLIHLLL
jgi:hypothetical protein